MGMRFWLVLGFALTAPIYLVLSRADQPPPGWHQDVPNGPVNVEGVPVSGHLDTVSVADMREALTAFKDIGLKDPAALAVIDKDQIRGYYQNRDMGWLTAKRVDFMWPDQSKHSAWDASGRGILEDSAARDFIKSSQQAFVFPVLNPLDPQRDDAHMRLLGSEARDRLIGLLDAEDNWLHGFNNVIYTEVEPGTVGFMLRRGNDEMVLFLVHSDVLVGTFNGEHLSGTLSFPNSKSNSMTAWKAAYAKPELAFLAASLHGKTVPTVLPWFESAGAILVDHVNAVGNLSAVSDLDLQDADEAFREAGLTDPDLLKVIDKDEIHAYLMAPDVILGWMNAKRVSCTVTDPGPQSCWHAAQQHLNDYASALNCIISAQVVYIFPITAASGPRLDAGHMRFLEDPIRRQLAALLGSKDNWTPGSAGTTRAPLGPATNIGFKFLDGKDEVTLFFSAGDKVQGTFNGEYMSGDLVEQTAKAFDKWKSQYAQSELATQD